MNQENWAKNNYQTGLSFIADHEDEAATNIIQTTDNNVTVILPSGLPLYGAGFYGIFMLAPIILFMLVISYLFILILTVNSLETHRLLLFSGGCLFFLWALTKALKLLTSTRDLFPRKYFTTIGEKGVAAHYSKLHFPLHSAITLKWDEIDSARSYSTLFLPGFFTGVFRTRIVEITSKDGAKLKIPFHSRDEQIISQKILDLINEKTIR